MHDVKGDPPPFSCCKRGEVKQRRDERKLLMRSPWFHGCLLKIHSLRCLVTVETISFKGVEK
jgi:hypothetical protein